jgi:hypothetical protein
MNIINQNSLSSTLDNLNHHFFENIKLSASEKKNVAKWISQRQGLSGSYWNMFAPTSSDFNGIKLFTGELVNTRAGISHILGEESCRALYLLGISDSFDSLEEALKGLKSAIKNCRDKGYESYGYYCCGKCTAAYWRNLSAADMDKNKILLKAGMKHLKAHRDGNGKWKRFPFYYTLYSISEIDLPEAIEELKYASPVCEKLERTMRKNGKFETRRFKLVQRVLEKI